MDLEEKVVTLAFLRKKFSKKKRHQHWVHPLLFTRTETGQFYTIFYELRKEESVFF
jgi:hypothetical protein